MINNDMFLVKKNGDAYSKCFCKHPELIENYIEAINSSDKYDCHHRLETHTSDGEKRLIELSRKELIALDMYYDRPAEELIFIKHNEHTILHHKNRAKPKTKEWAKKHSEAMKGRTAWNKGKKGCYTQTEESNRKRSEKIKGRHWKLVNGKRVYDKYKENLQKKED